MRFTLPIALLFVWISVAGIAGQRAADPGFVPIFDGVTLTGWDGDQKFWRVEDGAITGESTAENPCKRNTFLIWRLGELDDFELRLRYRITAGNSGIQYRSVDRGNWDIGGYQADISADGQEVLRDVKCTGRIVNVNCSCFSRTILALGRVA